MIGVLVGDYHFDMQIRSTDYNPQISQINADYFFRLNTYPQIKYYPQITQINAD